MELREARRGDERVQLSQNEASLLRFLAAQEGAPASKERLQVEVLGYSPRTVSRAADFAIHRLRKKLERDPQAPRHLLTVPGVGYRLVTGPPEEPPVSVGDVASHNLPAETTSFVGREAELDDALGLLEAGARLLTLTGPGGAGKTRLALRLAAAWFQTHREPVRFCELAQARDAATFCAGVAAVLGTSGESRSRIGTALAALGPLVLVLDNLEQVVADAAEATAAWLAMAPELRVVATSRERLRIPGERLVEVGPLDSDDAGSRLFIARATVARRSFRAEDHDPVIRRLVERLDGLPLAIELAASRSTVLSPQQMLERLERAEDMDRAVRGAPDRHVTVERAIAWSWDLLDEDERSALAQLATFRGGFDAEAAEAVIRGVDRPVLNLVQELREKSLLVERPGEGVPRFGFLLSVRDFAEPRCEDRRGAWIRHAEWVVGRARPHAVACLFADTPAPPALKIEWSNLDVATQRLVELGERPDLLAEAVCAAMRRYAMVSDAEAYLGLLEHALVSAYLPDELELRLRLTRAFLFRIWARQVADAGEECLKAVALARSLGRPDAEALAYLTHASLLQMEDQSEAAWAALDAARAALANQPPTALDVRVEVISANSCMSGGQLVQARVHLNRALERSAQGETPEDTALILSNLAYLSSRTGQHAEQARLARLALLRCREFDLKRLERRTLLWLAIAESEMGKLDDALRHGHDILALCVDTPDAPVFVESLITLAGAEFARGELEEVERLIRMARQRAANLRAPWHRAVIDQWEALACWARWGSLERATGLLTDGVALAAAHLPQARIFLESKLLAARAHGDLAAHPQLIRAWDQLEADAHALGRPDLAEPVGVDRAHLHLALAANAQARGEAVEPHLGAVRAQLFEGALDVASQGLGAVCSRVLLASVYAEFDLRGRAQQDLA